MQQQIEQLLKIAQNLGLEQLQSEIASILSRQSQDNPLLILPLVGEFSSGKTSLINSLTDSKALETATKPTTATIYEVHFGCDRCSASVLNEDGKIDEYSDPINLKNDHIKEAKVVTVFDTSSKVPPTTVLVDTPGLSSPDPKHKQTLINFLPHADGILLVVDINQQITRSLTDFIDMMKLSKKPIFLVLTKSDTKTTEDIIKAKKYIGENCNIPISQIAVVSAVKNQIDELIGLFSEIQKSKKEIISAVDKQRTKEIAIRLSEHIDELINSATSDEIIDESIKKLQLELNKINRQINVLIDSVSDDILEKTRLISRKFEDTVQSKLNALAVGKSANFDAEAISMINGTCSLLQAEFQDEIQTILTNAAKKENSSSIDSSFLRDISLDDLKISKLSYNLDLNTMGHEYDGWIKTGIIAAAAIGAVAIGVEPGSAGIGINAIDIADTISDVGSIVSNMQTTEKIEKVAGTTGSSQMAGSSKGLIDSIVGLATDKFISKPQRVHAVRTYVESSLSPEFKSSLQRISKDMIARVRDSVSSRTAQIIEQKESTLNQLKRERTDKKEQFDRRISELKEYKKLLSYC